MIDADPFVESERTMYYEIKNLSEFNLEKMEDGTFNSVYKFEPLNTNLHKLPYELQQNIQYISKVLNISIDDLINNYSVTELLKLYEKALQNHTNRGEFGTGTLTKEILEYLPRVKQLYDKLVNIFGDEHVWNYFKKLFICDLVVPSKVELKDIPERIKTKDGIVTNIKSFCYGVYFKNKKANKVFRKAKMLLTDVYLDNSIPLISIVRKLLLDNFEILEKYGAHISTLRPLIISLSRDKFLNIFRNRFSLEAFVCGYVSSDILIGDVFHQVSIKIYKNNGKHSDVYESNSLDLVPIATDIVSNNLEIFYDFNRHDFEIINAKKNRENS